MIERERSPGELKEAFQVLGSIGNVRRISVFSACATHPLPGPHCHHRQLAVLHLPRLFEGGPLQTYCEFVFLYS